ncbi:methyltransferase domain-containing protein [uncultured Tenacibaculum sp.]|uniref:methyltransferase domain-containing protein n=1 Tax=uncultured Tenacibaculum sp. TaxID=174713 RepID=UPI00262A6A69|nr:methyltransferase domain-containing protein [uncultured Tenacibaculum sp.]
MSTTKDYWSQRYIEERTGWDLGTASLPLQTYFDQLTNKDLSILIPGAGNSYEAEYLYKNGFSNVEVLDIANEPLQAFAERNPDFPKNQLLEADFFEFEGQYDLIIEQTFFCSFPPLPETRKAYAKKMYELLKPNGKLVGLWFDIPLTGDLEKRPFGGDKEEYLSYFSEYFEVLSFEKSYNSVAARKDIELFGIFKSKCQFE